MITVSLIKELGFISESLGSNLSVNLKIEPYPDIKIDIEKGVVSIFFLNNLVWKESISGASSNFGLESCQTISEIMRMAYRGEDWKKVYPYVHI